MKMKAICNLSLKQSIEILEDLITKGHQTVYFKKGVWNSYEKTDIKLALKKTKEWQDVINIYNAIRTDIDKCIGSLDLTKELGVDVPQACIYVNPNSEKQNDIDNLLKLIENKIVVLTGQSGAGKSTLLKMPSRWNNTRNKIKLLKKSKEADLWKP